MNKINKIALLIISFLLPFTPVQADITSDLANDLSFEKVIENGLKSGLPMNIVLVKIFSATQEDQRIAIVSAAISLSPFDAPLIVRAAIRAGVDAEEVVTEAVALAPLDRTAITQAAIAAGADVMDVTLASAAGIARSGVTLSSSGPLGSFTPTPPTFEGGVVPQITPPRATGGGARPPVTPPGVGISPS